MTRLFAPLRLFTAAVFAATALSTTACSIGGVAGTGEYTRQKRDVSGFTAIQIAGNGRVEIRQGAAFAVEVEAQANIMDLIVTELSGSALKIKTKGSLGNHKEIHYYITMPDLQGIAVSGSGTVVSKDIFSPKKVELSVAGSGNISGNFIAGEADVDISGSGDITLTGSAEELDIEIAGSGNVDAAAMQAKLVEIDNAGSGGSKVAVSEELKVDIAGSGSVEYTGNPGKVEQNVKGSGRVVKK